MRALCIRPTAGRSFLMGYPRDVARSTVRGRLPRSCETAAFGRLAGTGVIFRRNTSPPNSKGGRLEIRRAVETRSFLSGHTYAIYAVASGVFKIDDDAQGGNLQTLSHAAQCQLVKRCWIDVAQRQTESSGIGKTISLLIGESLLENHPSSLVSSASGMVNSATLLFTTHFAIFGASINGRPSLPPPR